MTTNGSRFVGRSRELRWIEARLADPTCRVITLMGPGGIGKTRLALQVATAAATSKHFDDGVCVVELASITTPLHLAPAIASALGLSLHGPEEPIRQIIDVLRDRSMLLVLDNMESLLSIDNGVGTTHVLTEVLLQAQGCKILVTSRERLHLREEWAFPVVGLPFPSDDALDREDNETDAVQLFMACAQQASPEWGANPRASVARDICRYVEGMPLAIEIAASWLRAMPPEAVLAHLKRDLDFLTSPARNMSARHASIRAVFDGSWALLSETEQTALAGLAVFRGGFDLPAANAVIHATPQVLAVLIDKSLVRIKAIDRYEIHELLRQYAINKQGIEARAIADRHLNYFTALAHEAETALYGPAQIGWFDRLEIEHGNLNAALEHVLATGNHETGLQLAGALGWFWQLRIHLREGSDWLAKLLAQSNSATVTASTRAKALHRASELETQLGHPDRAYDLAEEAIAIARANGDRWNLAWGLAALGLWGKHDTMRTESLDEALTLFRAMNDGWGISHTLRRLALFLVHADDAAHSARSAALALESLTLARVAGDKSAIAWSLFAIAFAHWQQVDLRGQAINWLRESLPMFRETRDANGLAMALDLLSGLEFMNGDTGQALAHVEENLSLALERTWIPPLTSDNSLAVCALLLWRRGDHSTAVALVTSIANSMDITQPSSPNFLLGPQLNPLWVSSRSETMNVKPISREQVLGDALRALDTHDTVAKRTESPLIEPLSGREREVLSLLAAGQSNAQAAQTLSVSTGTIKVHTRNIYGKLGVGSRTQAVARARELGLL